MSWIRDHAFGLSVSMVLVSGTLLVLLAGYIGLVLFSAIETGASVMGVVSTLMIPYAPVMVVLFVILLVSAIIVSWKLLAIGWGAIRRVTSSKSERLQTAAEYAEQKYPLLDALELAELVAPPESSVEDDIEELKSQYVAGNLSEEELERKLARLVATESTDGKRTPDEYEDSSNEGTAVLAKAWNDSHSQLDRR